jgi:Cu-Zn family superoxide dismutase
MRNLLSLLAGGVVLLAFVAPGFTQEPLTVKFINATGKNIGTATLTETHEGVLVRTNLSRLPKGWHAFHVHTVGKCEPKDFTTAGGHYNPENHQHGFENPAGSHAGDLPNVYVDKNGKLKVEALVRGVTLAAGPHSLLDADGSALMIHEGVDDYTSDPAGNAGARIACGAIVKQ